MARLYTYYLLSGSNTPGLVIGSGAGTYQNDIRFYVDYSYTQSQANNTSTITAKLYAQAGTAYSGPSRIWHGTNWPFVTIGGQTFTLNEPDQSFYGSVQYGNTITKTIKHNTDGSAPDVYIQARGYNYFMTIGEKTSATLNTKIYLPTIPRYATINSYNLTTASMTSLNVSWSANVTCDQVQYRIGSGSWVTAQTGDRSSGSFSITGLNPGTQYSIKIRVRRKDSQLYTESSAKNATTVDIARITSANDFNDTEKPTINFSNPSGAKIDVFLGYSSGTGIWRYDIPNTGSYEFNLTEEEWNILYDYNKTLSYFTILYKIVTNDEYEHSVVRHMTIINANPIFNNFTYEDINATTLALTGDDQTIVKNYSNLKATVSLENKAVAQKGANMVKYRLVVGAKQIDVNYDDENAVELTLNAIDNNVFMVYAIDSRNNSTVVQKSPNVYIDYFRPIIARANAERTGGIGSETTLIFNGSFLNIDFGSEQNNITIAYKYKKTSDEEYIDGTTTITPIINENNFSFEGLIAGDKGALGFDSQYSYNIKIIATDKLSSNEYDLILGTGKPNMAIHRDGVAINQPYDENLGGALQVTGNKIMFNGLTLFEWVED